MSDSRRVEDLLLEDFKIWVRSDLEDPRMKFIITQMINSMSKLCKECQADRFRCTFEPLCEDRRWLSILIEMKVPRRFWPQFCYSRRKEEIENFLKKKSIPTPLIDAVFPLKDFISIFVKNFQGKISQNNIDELIKHLSEHLIKKWKKVNVVKLSNNKIIILLGRFETILIIDLAKSQVVINAHKIGISSDSEMIEFLVKLGEIINLELKIIHPYPGKLYIHVLLDKKDNALERVNHHCSSAPPIKIVDFKDKIRITYEVVRRNELFFPTVFDISGAVSFFKCIASKILTGGESE